ncbi:hypothetical protein JHK85_033570 [Glycine max]|nr:hypothetical protein JHK85_033570 [Glycine max]
MGFSLKHRLIYGFNVNQCSTRLLFELVILSHLWLQVTSLGSMSSIAISYGEKGSVFCGLKSDGSHTVTCYGSNSAIIYGTPTHFSFLGLTAGDGFVCGLLMGSNQPYCWGSSAYIEMGVPQPMIKGAQYLEISAGDYHVCGLRKPMTGRHRNISLVDCWGYNMTKNYVFGAQIQSISAGSEFNCGLFSQNRTVFCWGDETNSLVISLIPHDMRFHKISAGGYHVCGISEGVSSKTFCWGRSLNLEEEISVSHAGQGNVDLAPNDPMLSVVGGKFHACGIKSYDRGVICWGFIIKPSTPSPKGIKVFEVAAGDYFTCAVLAVKSLMPSCWGVDFPTSLPLAVSPGMCQPAPCAPGSYAIDQHKSLCKSPDSRVCMRCSGACPPEMHLKSACNLASDRVCEYNCSCCSSSECFLNCSSSYSNAAAAEKKSEKFWALQLPVLIAEIAFAVFVVSIVSITAVLYIRYRLRDCPADSGSPLAELPAGTLGYLDPEYYRLHYLTTKSDVYSFGVLLLEILSGRKAIDMQYEEGNIVEWAVPLIKSGDITAILDPVLKPPPDLEALKRIANVACKCVRMRGKERPSMDKVTTALERGLAQLMGSPCIEQPILPTEVVLGSNRLHKKSSQRSSNRSVSETDVAETEDQRFEFRAPSWITFPSVTSSQRRKSSVSEADVDGKNNAEGKNMGNVGGGGDVLRSLEEEIGPASPRERLFLQHNF